MTGTASPPRPGYSEALRTFASSSRQLLRIARGRYTTDLVTWPYREEFRDLWQTVDFIPGWFHEGSAAVLYGLIREQAPATVVEIGSYLGRSTVFFALALRSTGTPGRVIAIDPHTGDRQQLEGLSADRLPTYELFRQHCRAAQVEDIVDARVMPSSEAAHGWTDDIDLLYVDGWHSYDGVLDDGHAWLPHLSPDGVVVFDDYVAYPEVRQAIEELDAEGAFHLWGDLFGQAIGGPASHPPPSIRRALSVALGRRRRR